MDLRVSQELIHILDAVRLNPETIRFTGQTVNHNLCFPIDEIMAQIHGIGALLISDIWEQKTKEKQTSTIDITHAYLSPASVFLLQSNGYPVYPWDGVYPTVDLYRTRDDRYIFINGGYPQLRDSILKVLEVPNDKQYLTDAIKEWDAEALEDALAQAHACAAIVREKNEWLSHPQGKILSETPLIDMKKVSDTSPEPFNKTGDRPLSGLKVLDLSWVVAAPTCARIFAEHGADVLHISAPHLPHIPPFAIETGNGKREAYLDLRNPKDLDRLKILLSEADILVEGWRPGIMNKYGLTPEEVQKIRPGIIHITLSCYGKEGPFANRAGWEQLGQSVSGIIASNLVETSEDAGGCGGGHSNQPSSASHKKKGISDTLRSHGLLVCDYTTGVLGALGGLNALINRSQNGGGYHIHVSLSRSGTWLMSQSSSDNRNHGVAMQDLPLLYKNNYSGSSQGPLGKLDFLLPVMQLSKTPPFFTYPSSPLGSGKAEWRDKPI